MKVKAGFIASQLPSNPGNDDIRQAVQEYFPEAVFYRTDPQNPVIRMGE